MIEITDKNLFGKIVAESLVSIDQNQTINTANKLRWIKAIGKASARMELPSECLLDFDAETSTMTIWNVGRNNALYQANNGCQCLAFEANQPCWHLAAKRLYQKYLENISPVVSSQKSLTEMQNALYYKPEIKSEKINGVRI